MREGKVFSGTGVRIATPVTEVERICVSFRDQSADWSWESVIPLYQGRGERIATTSDIGHWFRNDRVFARSAVQVRRQGEGTPPYGTVCRGGRPCPPAPDNATPCRAGPVCPAGCGKNLSGRCRERPLRKRNKRCSGQATTRVAPTVGIIWGHEVFLFSCKFILEKQLGICYTLHYSGNKFLSA